jgi:hypothetical protein
LKYELVKQISSRLQGPHNCANHRSRSLVTRREFARTAAGAAIGAGVGLGLPRLLHSEPKGTGQPNFIPGGSPVVGGFHVFGPAAFDPVDAEPITITDLNGFVGLAYISGKVTRKDKHSAEVRRLNMEFSDMRFMSGVYKGVDGRTYQGAFGFI